MSRQLPNPDTPLYHHALPALEGWLEQMGCQRDKDNICLWRLRQPSWSADVELCVEDMSVRWTGHSGGTTQRSFPYSLSRSDVERAIMVGP
ncbi:DUF3143 domain-containing protein [Candidatus Synechococcus spongiarum]|uniref:DUF3143 domain-containing protein n=1 Tax=Candidatus Synechococcus spongiarum TaxID=431041 RepID=UPI000471DF3A|nr:DUF3143 domain-containing protein [Candidatus Synechococcus spongiarum]